MHPQAKTTYRKAQVEVDPKSGDLLSTGNQVQVHVCYINLSFCCVLSCLQKPESHSMFTVEIAYFEV